MDKSKAPSLTFVNAPDLKSIRANELTEVRSKLSKLSSVNRKTSRRTAGKAIKPNANQWQLIRPAGEEEVCSNCRQSRNPKTKSTCSSCAEASLRMPESINFSWLSPLLSVLEPSAIQPATEITQWAATVLLPVFKRENEYAQLFFQQWLSRVMSSPLAMHAVFYSWTSLRDALKLANGGQLTAANNQHRLHHQVRALALVRKALDNDPFNNSDGVDDMITAMTCLACHESTFEKGLLSRVSSPFRPCFPRAQWMDLYGLMTFDPRHWQAAVYILKKIGGPTKVKTFGIPYAISTMGLMIAASSMTKPVYPMSGPTGAEMTYEAAWKPFGLDFEDAGSGFKCLDLDPDYIKTFVDLSKLSCALQLFAPQESEEPDDRLLDSRNLMMHRLLSLPQSIDGSIDASTLFEVLRLTALIYSIHVIYPLYRSKIRDSVSQLQDTIEQADRSSNESLIQVLLWSSIIGSIATIGQPENSLLVSRASIYCEILDLQDFEDMKSVLKRFAWVDYSCDIGAKTIWMYMNQP